MNDFSKGEKVDVRRMLDMQSLLEEYDRENRYLNKQVLQLLAENKALKIDKVRQKSLKWTAQQSQKNLSNRRRPMRWDQNDIVTKWKRELHQSRNKQEKKTEKKEEGVQVQPIVHVSPPKVTTQESDRHKQVGSQVFSFGEDTTRHAKHKASKQESPSLLVEKEQSFKKVGSTGEKEGMIEESRDKTFIMDVAGIESSERFITEEKERLKTEERDFSLAMRQQQTQKLEDKSRKRGKSSHAIDPSPRIVPNSSEKKMETSMSGSIKKTFLKVHQSSHKYASVQKKRFLDVISRGSELSFKAKLQGKPEGCC